MLTFLRLPSLVRAALGAALLGLFSACNFGGQGTDGPDECESTDIALSSDSRAGAIGFAPDDVLAWAKGTHELNARWNAPPTATTTSAVTGPVQLSVTIERAPGDAVDIAPQEGCGTEHLSIPVTVVLATDDGQLEERVSTELISHREDFASVRFPLDPNALTGELAWQTEEPDTELSLMLDMALTPDSSAFALTARAQRVVREGNSVAQEIPDDRRLLAWPEDTTCTEFEVPHVLSDADALYAAALEHAVTHDWSDANTGSVTVAVEAAEQLCEGAGGWRWPAALALLSDDGAIDLTLDGIFVREDDRLVWRPSTDRELADRPREFAAAFGDFGLELEGYTHVTLEISAWLSGDDGEVALRVLGPDDLAPAETLLELSLRPER